MKTNAKSARCKGRGQGAKRGIRRGTIVMARSTTPVAALLAASALALAQHGAVAAPPYCSELKEVVAVAMSEGRFARLAGKPREGNFSDTSLPLTGWSDCSVYGTRTYTCDTRALETAERAEQSLPARVAEVKACLGPGWAEIAERSSPSYVVLHGAGAVSITISTDQTDERKYVVRLTMFLRGSQ